MLAIREDVKGSEAKQSIKNTIDTRTNWRNLLKKRVRTGDECDVLKLMEHESIRTGLQAGFVPKATNTTSTGIWVNPKMASVLTCTSD